MLRRLTGFIPIAHETPAIRLHPHRAARRHRHHRHPRRPPLPGAQGRQRRPATRSVALSNMRQIGAAFILYANDNSYMLPSRVDDSSGPDKWPAPPRPSTSATSASTPPVTTSRTGSPAASPAPRRSATRQQHQLHHERLQRPRHCMAIPPAVQIRINAFPSTSDIILLGTPLSQRRYPTARTTPSITWTSRSRPMATKTTSSTWLPSTAAPIISSPTARPSSSLKPLTRSLVRRHQPLRTTATASGA